MITFGFFNINSFDNIANCSLIWQKKLLVIMRETIEISTQLISFLVIYEIKINKKFNNYFVTPWAKSMFLMIWIVLKSFL